MHNDRRFSWPQLDYRTTSGLPFLLALLAAGFFVSAHCLAAPVAWRICEVYSNGDRSSQFIQFCGASDDQLSTGNSLEKPLSGRTVVASDGITTHSFVIPGLPATYYDSHRFLIGTQGFADLNLARPDFIVPNGFLFGPNGSISLADNDTVQYAGLPTDGIRAIDTDFASRPGSGEPATAVTLATAVGTDGPAYSFASPRGSDVADGRWVLTGELNEARISHTATLLPNGKVLVAGGTGNPPDSYHPLATAELYDPATGTWSATGRLVTPKTGHSATLLPNGKVLVVGGNTDDAELYDPSTGTWTAISAPPGGVYGHTATLLNTGKVLIIPDSYHYHVLYDPATGSWSSANGINVPRDQGQATLLQDGRVLLTGGTHDPDYAFPLHAAEAYDPIAGTWSKVTPLHFGHAAHTATLLNNGTVLIPGSVTELFDPATGRWSIAEPLGVCCGNTATLLPDGRVLVVAGYRLDAYGNAFDTNDAVIYDSLGRTLRDAASRNASRAGHTATALPNGKVLIAGGSTGLGSSAYTILNSAELYESGGPFTPSARTISAGFTGSWYDPAQSGHGFALQVLTGPPKQLLAYWFTFSPQGDQSWIAALGPIDGNHAVLPGVQTVGAGARFPPNFDAANARQQSWGTLTFTFSDCNHGHVDWNSTAPGYGSGGMDLTRLTLPAGLTCPQ